MLFHIKNDLFGKICKVNSIAEKIEEALKGDGSYSRTEYLYETVFIFNNEEPFYQYGYYWYCCQCLETGDWKWFTLNQLIICSEEEIPKRLYRRYKKMAKEGWLKAAAPKEKEPITEEEPDFLPAS